MNSFSTFLLILIVLLLGFDGYFYLDQIIPMQTELKEVGQKNHELLFQVENLKSQNGELNVQLEKKVGQVSQQKNKEINDLKKTYVNLVGELKEQVEKGEVTISQMADQLNVKILDKIIFPSGKAELSERGKKVLKRIGNILKNVKDKHIKVEGHTDNVPIHPNLQKQFEGNWELSTARAINVVRFMQNEIGISGENLEASGRSQYKPVATNKTVKGRNKNRRIEIMLLPKIKKRS